MNVGEFRAGLQAWLDENDLTPGRITRSRPHEADGPSVRGTV